jgi:hypothetical protein
MTNQPRRSNPIAMSELRSAEIERRFVSVMQAVVAIPWLVFGHSVHSIATAVLSIALCAFWIRPAPAIPRAIAWRKPRLLCGAARG